MNLVSSNVRHGIADVDPFASLGADCLSELQHISFRRGFTDGQIIYLQGDDARFLNVVTSGHAGLSYVMEDGSAVLHDIVPRHAIFGELSILDRSTYPDIATAVGQVSLISLPSTALFDLVRVHAPLAQVLRGMVAVRYRAYITLVRNLSLQSLSARLARTVIRVADRLDTRIDHGGRRAQAVGAIVTQTDLGLMARGSRGNVNRALQTWQRMGWIAIKDRSIIILDRDALSDLAVNHQD